MKVLFFSQTKSYYDDFLVQNSTNYKSILLILRSIEGLIITLGLVAELLI